MTWVDDLIDLMGDKPGKPSQVHPFFYFAAITPMWLMVNTKIELQLIVAVLITINSYIRLMHPSQYNPALQSTNSVLSHPFLGRTVATMAEVTMYWIWARWINEPYWGSLLGNTVLIGELVCWLGILFCSRTFHFCEDSFWIIHAAEMLYLSKSPMQQIAYGSFVIYVGLVHLPRQTKTIKPLMNCKRYKGTIVKQPDKGNKAWQVPVLLSMPLFSAYIFYDLRT